MVYAKYLLWKTGVFPKWEPRVDDVLYAAIKAHEVKFVVTPHKHGYYYVIPANYNIEYLYNLVRVFRANGIILRPHRSHNYNSIVFRVPAHGQSFIRDVVRVSHDADNFKQVLTERGINPDNVNIRDMIDRIKQKRR